MTDERFEQARRETIPALRAEAGLPPEEEDDEGGYEEERERYLELLESTVIGKQMAITMLKERTR